VTLTKASSTSTVVNYTIGGTATNGTDYATLTTSVTVSAGQTTATITIDVTDDQTVESTEDVSVTLTGTDNTLISASGSASLNITDDDTASASVAKSTPFVRTREHSLPHFPLTR